jgi:drug/metabolite transporter (DMT)-like permease
MTNTFGAFQTYYINTLLPDSSPSAISWIGSIQTFTMMFVGVLSGRLLDAGYLRPQLCAGIFLEVLGLILVSISTKYWQILISQGLCVGLGAGLLYLPGVAVPAQYFSSKVMFATGIVATGSSMGMSPFSLDLHDTPADSGQANAQGCSNHSWSRLSDSDSPITTDGQFHLDRTLPINGYPYYEWYQFDIDAPSPRARDL